MPNPPNPPIVPAAPPVTAGISTAMPPTPPPTVAEAQAHLGEPPRGSVVTAPTPGRVLVKARSRPDLDHYRRAGVQLTPQAQIFEVDEATAKALEADAASVFVSRVTPEEAAAYNSARRTASTDPESLAAENAQLRSDQAALSARVAELEEAMRGLLADRGVEVDDFGGEPGRPPGVKPSIAPGREGKRRSE